MLLEATANVQVKSGYTSGICQSILNRFMVRLTHPSTVHTQDAETAIGWTRQSFESMAKRIMRWHPLRVPLYVQSEGVGRARGQKASGIGVVTCNT